ncbi:hypothetical protein CBS9595_001772 [Malassezia furfur]|nr:hypothetical protein CBS9595_001772 [Malassezia furfur]
MLGLFDAIWSSDDFTRTFRLSVLNGVIPVLAALGVSATARWHRYTHHRPAPPRRRLSTWPLDPIQQVLHQENEIIFRTASGVLADDPRVHVPRSRNLKNTVDLACAMVLAVIHGYGVTSEYDRYHFYWFLAWLSGSSISLLAWETREPFWAQKLCLSASYVLVMLCNVRSEILANNTTLEYDDLAQLVLGTTVLVLALFVPSPAELPPQLVRLHTDFKPLPGAGTPAEIPPPPNYYVSPFMRATFSFITGFVWKQYWEPTTLNSVPEILPPYRAACIVGLSRRNDETVNAHIAGAARQLESLHRRLWRAIGGSVLKQWLLQLFRVCFRMGPILALSALLAFAEERDAAERMGTTPPPLHMGLLWAGLIFASQMAEFLCDVNCLQLGRAAATQARSLITTEVFSKILRRRMHYETRSGAPRDAEPTHDADDGRVINLVSVDATKIDALISLSHQPLLEYPLTITLCVALLFHVLGVAAFAGILIMLLATPLQTRLSKRMLVVQDLILRATDARLRLANEVLACIKTVKFFAWETPFVARMNAARAEELRMLMIDNVISVLSSLLFVGMPMLVTLATFGIYTLVLGEDLTAQKAFTALSIFNAMRVPLADLPELLVVTLNSWVSIQRIDTFLRSPDTDKYEQQLHAEETPDSLGFRAASFTYAAPDAPRDDAPSGTSTPRFQLVDLDCQFPLHALSIVVGPVGCGKTSLLLALLGELRCTAGAVTMPRAMTAPTLGSTFATHMAYCAQSPWIFNTTVRENILFGNAYDERRYRFVLEACALGPDLDILEYHDATEVGEKGTSLSGGQKARIALARAFYSRASTILIDDALSAVDAHTAHHLVERCLCGPLAQDRTILLVTHAVALVQHRAAYAVAMDAGRIVAHGTPAELRRTGHLDDDTPPDAQAPAQTSDLYEEQEPANQHWAATQLRRDRKNVEAHAERIHRHAQGSQLYRDYFRAVAARPSIAVVLWAGMLALYVGVRTADVSGNAWLRRWAQSYVDDPDDPDASARTPRYYLVRYVLLVVAFVLLSGARDLAQFTLAVRASRRLYAQLVTSLLRAPPRFFDVTPIGRIMNRLAKDVQTVDTEIRPSLRMLTEAIVTLFAILAVICWATPQFLYLAGLVLAVYYVIGALYLASSRDLKRIESVQRSPLYTLLGETLSGTVTLRAFGDTDRVVRECMRLLDNSARAFLCLWYENRWVSVRVDAMGALVTLTTAVLLLYTHADAALLGFTLSYAVLIVNTILRIVRRYTMTEITLNSVERIEEYIHVPPEQQGGAEPPAHWPTDTGGIEVKQLCVRYAHEFPLALSNVSLRIAPGEKVGIVGRTGSGKSTLSLAFFRFLEAESGSIVIDGVDISTITLEALRRRLTIIPQDAQLFQGTVRMNLDPFDAYDDGDMWFALQRCQLATSAEGAAGFTPTDDSVVRSLDDPVEQGGTNFSAGQRQLLSLARGLLKMRDSRILILDESTANLDADADALIQRTIREQMAPNATLLTVAHRLKTIIDYDKVLVLDQGKVLEYDTPANLLANTHTEFYALCKRSGELDALTEAAHTAQRARRPHT